MRTVWFIRHGQSEGNAGGRATTPTDAIPLTQLGHTQAAAVAATVAPTPDLICVTRHLRTQQTAAPLIERFRDIPVLELPIHEITYLRFEHVAGSNAVERQNIVDTYWNACDPSYCDGEGAESFADFLARLRLGRQILEQRTEGFTVVYTHTLY